MPSEQLSWIDPAGTQVFLDGTDPNYYYLNLIGRQGMFGLPQQFIEQTTPIQPGAKLLYVIPGVNIVRVPLLIKSQSENDLANSRGYLRNLLNPLRGDGKLTYMAANGITRQLTCRLYSGLEGDETSGNRGMAWMVAPLIFRADDPYWYDQNATLVSYAASSTTAFFPILPLVLSSSSVFSGFSVFNNGDAECWPIWTITGPGTNPVLTNNTTGKAITLTATLGGSDVWTIDTRPGIKSITNQSGTNEYSALSTGSSLWSLAQGLNSIAISMSGTTSASGIQLQYNQRWLGV